MSVWMCACMDGWGLSVYDLLNKADDLIEFSEL